MSHFFEICASVAVVSYIICDTSAIESYLKLLLSLFNAKNEVIQPSVDLGLNFISRLRLKYPKGVSGFFVELLECPICLITWLSLASSLLCFGLDLIAGVGVFVSWVLYLFLRGMVKFANK